MDKANSDKNINIRSRFVKGRRQEALAEIEGWVGGSRAEIIKAGAAKVASQPSKNITEQKMLDSKLYDMSKQRFNFVLQCQWQRKLFLEKQKRKTAVMRDLLRNVDVTVVSENPFSTESKKRRGTVIPANRNGMIQHDTRQKASTTVPRLRMSADGNTPSRNVTFVTQRGFLPYVAEHRAAAAALSDTTDEEKMTEIGADHYQTTERTGEKTRKKIAWPMSDQRYLRLGEVLCENYPKAINLRQHVKFSSTHVAVAAGI